MPSNEVQMTDVPATLLLGNDIRETLAMMLKVALELPTGSDVADHVPINPWGDVEKFRQAVYLPLHGERPSASPGESQFQGFVLAPRDVIHIRDVIDRLAENFSGGSPWVAPTGLERAAVEALLARIARNR